eukprot:12242150-Heterocapsa_arctica.AAC.1
MGCVLAHARMCPANHTPKHIVDQGGVKWLCTVCGSCATRPIDLAGTCIGTPAQGSCRFWRARQLTLTRHSLGATMLKGRNADRPPQVVAPAGGGQLLRMLSAEAVPVAPPLNPEAFPPLPAPGEPVGTQSGMGPGNRHKISLEAQEGQEQSVQPTGSRAKKNPARAKANPRSTGRRARATEGEAEALESKKQN